MKNFYLLKYRIKYNDTQLKNKIKFTSILIIIIVIVPIFYFFNPLSNLKNLLEHKKVEILAYQEVGKQTSKISPTSNIILPISGTITSNYGYRIDPISGAYSKHTGIDISGIHHDSIRSIDSGVVTFAGSQSGYGYCIEIKHSNYYSFYAHLSKIKVSVNTQVNRGDIIGIEGGDPNYDPNPGYSTGHHLHFEIRTHGGHGNDINPINYINKKL